MLSFEEQLDLSKACALGDLEARDALVASVVPLIASVARTFTVRRSLSHEDLEQEGVVQLLRVIHQFDPTRALLSTFTCHVVRNAMRTLLKRVSTFQERELEVGSEEARHIIAENSLRQKEDGELNAELLPELLSFALPRQQELLRRLYLKGESASQIAEEEGVGRAAISLRHMKALRRIRKAVGVT